MDRGLRDPHRPARRDTSRVEQALYSRPRLVAAGREDTREVLGTTDANRYLFILVSEAVDGRDFVITARDMTDNEKRLCREKGR